MKKLNIDEIEKLLTQTISRHSNSGTDNMDKAKRISMVSKHQKFKKKSKTEIPEELVNYLDFAIRLRRSYEIIQKIQKYHS